MSSNNRSDSFRDNYLHYCEVLRRDLDLSDLVRDETSQASSQSEHQDVEAIVKNAKRRRVFLGNTLFIYRVYASLLSRIMKQNEPRPRGMQQSIQRHLKIKGGALFNLLHINDAATTGRIKEHIGVWFPEFAENPKLRHWVACYQLAKGFAAAQKNLDLTEIIQLNIALELDDRFVIDADWFENLGNSHFQFYSKVFSEAEKTIDTIGLSSIGNEQLFESYTAEMNIKRDDDKNLATFDYFKNLVSQNYQFDEFHELLRNNGPGLLATKAIVSELLYGDLYS